MGVTAVVRAVAIAVVCACASAQAGTIYVSTLGSDANTGQSWAEAKRSIQAGLNVATSGDQIWVAAGTYTENVTLKISVSLYGGFVGSETDLAQRNWVANETVLDGNQTGSVVAVASGATSATRIDGFTIRNGMAEYGGGISVRDVSPTIANNKVIGNRSSGSSPSPAGIYCWNSSATITGNTIVRNYGGGIVCSSGSPMIVNNIVTENKSGGIWCGWSSAMIANNMIAGNTASNGGGIYCYGFATIVNNIIRGNRAETNGGGICCSSGTPLIVNNTIVGNSATNNGGGIYAWNGATIINTIIAFNSSGIGSTGSGVFPSLRCNCVYGNTASNYSGLVDPAGADGNLSVDPRFTDMQYGNVHLRQDSPCVDAGDDSAVVPGLPDMDGQARIFGAHVDIGADEYDGTQWPVGPNVIVRVSLAGNDANDGSSWSHAKRTVQAGIETAGSMGGEVWVAAGIFVERVTLRTFVHLYGGFVGTEVERSKRDWSAYVTVLDGNRNGSVVVADGIETGRSTIDGFTIRNGIGFSVLGSGGAGIACRNSSPTIANNTITGNTVSGAVGNGGGICCVSSSPEIVNNVITGNSTFSASGGGIYTDALSAPTIAGNRIAGNSTTGPDSCGGGIGCDGPAIIKNNTITRNSTDAGSGWTGRGGGIWCSGAATIAGNTITDNSVAGQFACGGGISCKSGSPTIKDNTIKGNTANGSNGCGGGIYCWSCSPGITGNTIQENSASDMGSGICWIESSGTITDNTLVGNNAGGFGVIYCERSSSLAILHNAIRGNGGGCVAVYCYSGSPMIANNTITANSGGGVFCFQSSPTIVNNTIVGNHNGPTGAAIYCCSTSSPTIINTIVAFNSAGIYNENGSGSPSLRHNCVYGNGDFDFSGLADPAGTDGNISADPGLANPSYGNVHIQPDSPCIDAGDDSVVQTGWVDMDGQPRIGGACVDIGADESDGTSWPTGPSVIVRVSPKGNDANDGSSWPLAKRTVQAGIDAAAGLGGDVWVAEGTYIERISLRNHAYVYGGFAGTENLRSDRDWSTHPTSLDGNQGGSVVTISMLGHQLTTIDGFTIRNGSGTLSESWRYGGGIYCSKASLTMANNTVTNNSVSYDGGGIYCVGSALRIQNTTIAGNNSQGGKGGGIYCVGCTLSIANSTITKNSAHYDGGGIYCSSSPAVLVNNTITGNSTGYDGGGIECQDSTLVVLNNTIAGNTAARGGGIDCEYLQQYVAPPKVANTIIAFNSSGIYDRSGSPVLQHNCVYGNASYDYSVMVVPTGANGNISADPRLADLPYGNVHIGPDSPCVDAGDDSLVEPNWTDMDGHARVHGSHVDIGADEYDGAQWPVGPNVIVRVSPGGNNSNDGSSWALAKRTVQAAIDTAADLGGEVWVETGMYLERITLRDYVYVYGGFAGNETRCSERNWSTNLTVLDGGQGGSVVTARGLGYGLSAIDGFIIRNGKASLGGGVYSNGSSPLIANNTIIGNSASSGGGGVYCLGSSPPIVNNRIRDNSTTASGGGIFCDCYSYPMISNNIINGNSAAIGGGLYCNYGIPAVTNNTIAGNNGDGAIYCSNASVPIANTIVAFNSSGIYSTSGLLPLRYNCVYGNLAYNYSGVANPTGSNGNLSIDPKLADVLYGNVHIQLDSPCIDAGDDSLVQPGWQDMDGQARIAGAHVDIGADEYDGEQWPVGPNVIVRVSPAGSDANDGTSWTLAKRTVQAAIDTAAAAGGEVWVAAGTYLEQISLRNCAYVYGGFAGTETQRSQRDWLAHAAILDASRQGSAVTASLLGYGLSTVDGFTIRNGSGTVSGTNTYGGGIYCSNASPMILNNTITGNSATYGGGVYSMNAYQAIANNTITNNSGFGVFCSASRSSIVNNLISSNTSSGIACNSASTVVITGNTITSNNLAGSGGGIYCDSSTATITKNVIECNRAVLAGGGIFARYGTVSIADNRIVANSLTNATSGAGGGICRSNGTGTIRNNTVANNSAIQGGGIWCSGTTMIANTLVAFNSSGIFIYGTIPSLHHNCVYGNTGYNYSGMADPTDVNGNISADPQLARRPSPGSDGVWGTSDDDYGNLHLLGTSPCVNAGDPAYVPAAGETDMDGQPRKIGTRVDIGADEYVVPGDINGDNYVNVGDLQLLVAVWGRGLNYTGPEDINGDGFVNIGDLQLLVANWGKSL